MTKKDYEMIASDIRWTKKRMLEQGMDETTVKRVFTELELHLSRSFLNDNPRFNGVKFWLACGNKNPFKN